MCGITGYATTDPQAIKPEMLQRMAAAIAHRGPDSDGYFEENGIGLGHRRLSVLDTSARGKQPMQDVSGRYMLAHNGEIYNFDEVRGLLDYPFATQTDTELILAAWAKWGPGCLPYFAGMFAFAMLDRQTGKLYLVRDRLGIKPLYWRLENGQLLFGSEVRAILAAQCFQPRINRMALASYLVYQTTYTEATLVEGIHLLPAGHYGVWEKGAFTQHSYWNLWENASLEAKEMTAQAVRKRVEALMQQSIARRLVSDVPVGAFLSGGIDSSAVVALMAEASSQPVDTFSIVFNEKEYDESEWSGLMAKKYQTRHHPILLKPEDFLDALPAALRSMDHPSGDGINSYVVSQKTRELGVKVALSGLGGDELFAGYPIFTQLPAIQQKALLKLPRPLRNWVGSLYGSLRKGRQAEKVKALLALPSPSLEAIYPVFRTIYDWAALQKTLRLPASTPHPLAPILQDHTSARHRLPQLSQIGGLEILSYTHGVLLRDTDQMSMAHALEVREPFFDHDLVEFVMGIPDAIKNPGYPKQLLVEAMGDRLPLELVHRKKMGFVFPWERWLHNELRDFCATRIARMDARGLIGAPGYLPGIWKEFLEGRGPWLWTHIWLPVVLEEWIETNNVQA
jgi:asparagine synthase (glutamine-hydrolysing)